ncbi:GIY-YIG nuclease family protein [Candidatus Collierbacteria bacterium]|nr:GIY-YIG nuclease family protein [Candidatus Collierbacteria bacterium]
MFYTYILHSLKDGKLYTGFTPDLRSRIKAHENGFVRATKDRRPLQLIHYEAFVEEKDARNREIYLKGGNGKKELEVKLREYFRKKTWKK